jgi:hypothetical protein
MLIVSAGFFKSAVKCHKNINPTPVQAAFRISDVGVGPEIQELPRCFEVAKQEQMPANPIHEQFAIGE